MIIRRKGELIERIREDGVKMTDFFGGVCPTDGKVSMGCAVFPPGTVVPPAAHTGDEYGFILSGRMKCVSNGVVNEFEEGEASFIPAGEIHSSRNDSGEEAKVLWVLIEK